MPGNDSFSNRFALIGTPAVLTGELFTATSDAGDGLGNMSSLWWSWTATQKETVTLTPNPSYQSASVFTGAQLGQLVPVQRIGSGSMTFLAQSGTTYQVVLAGYPSTYAHTASAVLAPNVPPHVVFSTPTNGQRFTVGESIPVCVQANDDDGVITMVKSGYTENVFSFSPATSCYTLSNLPPGLTTLTATAMDDDGVIMSAPAVTIRIAPPNDDFESRAVIAANENEVVGFNTGAAAQSAEPMHAGRAPQASVWWSWTAPQSGNWTVAVRDSDFHTTLAIYTGAPLSSLVPVPGANQSRVGDLRSELAFGAIAGEIYHFAVDTADGLTGSFRLCLSRIAANDQFTNATAVLARSVVSTTTSSSTADMGETNGSHSLWYSWIAPTPGVYFASTAGSDFDTTLDVFTGMDLQSLSFVARDDDSGPDATSLVQFSATNAQMFRLRVDGFAGDSGAVKLAIALAQELSEMISPASNGARLSVFGFPFQNIEVQESTNLIAWRSLGTQRNNGGWFEAPATNSPNHLFYRALRH